jgi:hypothetical protein
VNTVIDYSISRGCEIIGKIPHSVPSIFQSSTGAALKDVRVC